MEQAILMATDTNTPVWYWFEMPLKELAEWIRTANRAFSKRNKELENLRKQQKRNRK